MILIYTSVPGEEETEKSEKLKIPPLAITEVVPETATLSPPETEAELLF